VLNPCAMQLECVAYADQNNHEETPGTDAAWNSSYRALQWSADGTCLIATKYDHAVDTFVIPADLLEERDELLGITPFSSISSPNPIIAVTGYPFFDLQNAASCLVLAAQRDHPIRLSSAITGKRVASYPLINPLTEAYICPNALVFTCDGSKFIAASESLISSFDVSSSGSAPVTSIQTGPKKLQDDRWNPTTSLRGIVSALAVEPGSRILAAGTFSRQIGLYEAEGMGSCTGAFSIAGNDADSQIGGGGVTQLSWSPCGKYLYIGERKSDGLMVYDIRNTGQLLSWCVGRKALTNQRLGYDITTLNEGNYEVWAGGLDGEVRTWSGVHLKEGTVKPDSAHAVHTGTCLA
jgi:telomerase Cajal body protein 1